MSEERKVRMMSQNRLTRLPIIRVKSDFDKEGRIVGNNVHDQYILGKDGGLHYFNMQGCAGTEYGEYEFLVEEPQDEYDIEKTFDTANFLELMDIDAKNLDINENEDYLRLRKSIEGIFLKAGEEKQKRLEDMLAEMILKAGY